MSVIDDKLAQSALYLNKVCPVAYSKEAVTNKISINKIHFQGKILE
jgi:hypothetical protein